MKDLKDINNKQEHTPELPALLYKLGPDWKDIRSATTLAELYKLFRQAYKVINRKRVGRYLRKYRKRLGYDMEEMRAFLDQNDISVSKHDYTAIEAGTCSFKQLNILLLTKLSGVMHMPLEKLIHKD